MPFLHILSAGKNYRNLFLIYCASIPLFRYGLLTKKSKDNPQRKQPFDGWNNCQQSKTALLKI